jgi:hypothetical protein
MHFLSSKTNPLPFIWKLICRLPDIRDVSWWRCIFTWPQVSLASCLWEFHVNCDFQINLGPKWFNRTLQAIQIPSFYKTASSSQAYMYIIPDDVILLHSASRRQWRRRRDRRSHSVQCPHQSPRNTQPYLLLPVVVIQPLLYYTPHELNRVTWGAFVHESLILSRNLIFLPRNMYIDESITNMHVKRADIDFSSMKCSTSKVVLFIFRMAMLWIEDCVSAFVGQLSSFLDRGSRIRTRPRTLGSNSRLQFRQWNRIRASWMR